MSKNNFLLTDAGNHLRDVDEGALGPRRHHAHHVVGVAQAALRHVAGAAGIHAARQLGRCRHGHGIGGTAKLEGADRLQVLQLEPDLAWRAVVVERHMQAHQRCAHRRAPHTLTRRLDVGQREIGERAVAHRVPPRCTVTPRPVACACVYTYCAAAISSMAMPSDLNSVISVGLPRPGRTPRRTSPSSPTMWASVIAPSRSGKR